MWENFVFLVIFVTCDVVYNWSISLLPPIYNLHSPVLQIKVKLSIFNQKCLNFRFPPFPHMMCEKKNWNLPPSPSLNFLKTMQYTSQFDPANPSGMFVGILVIFRTYPALFLFDPWKKNKKLWSNSGSHFFAGPHIIPTKIPT